MLRAVLDVNVLVAAMLSASGTPAQLLRSWRNGEFDLIVSPALLLELERVLGYPKIEHHVLARDAQAFLASLKRNVSTAADPSESTYHSADPAVDYLLNLAASQNAILVSGDAHVLAMTSELPIQTPAEFRAFLQSAG